MRRPTLPARIAGIAALALVALALPSGALAAPTGSQIAAPSDPAFARYDADAPSTLHVAGTTSGGTGDVDLRCYFGATSGLVAAGVAVSGGSFTADVPVTKALVSALADPQAYCVLRAVPTGTAPAAPPGQASAFQGPHIGWGWAQTNPIGAGNDPNPAELLQDYYVSQAQAQAFNDYDSAGDCGLCDTYLFDPTTFARSNPIWWANAWLQYKVTGSITPRSSVQVDGVDVYNPHAAWSVAGYALADNPGLPGLTVTNEVDPANGNVTITETDPFASCTPQPATYPPTDASCASFSPPVVKLVRKISQHDHGLQVTIADHWQSLDGQPHQLDAMYADENRNANYATVGHEGRWDFTWTGAGFKTYPAGTPIAPPAAGPATVLLKTDGSTPDGGDGSNPIGALTYGTPPSELTLVWPTNAAYATGLSRARYQRTIPASGELVITQIYSHDFSLASVQSKAAAAEQALIADPDGVRVPPPAAGDTPTSTPDTASTTVVGSPTTAPPTTTAAAVAKCKVPKLRGRTLTSAKRLLRHAHCRLGKVTRKASARVRPGRVVASKPRAGSLRTRGARIAIALAKRP
jgi:hypothetical protein